MRICYITSRIYAGYATTNLNPEPYAYESGFSVKWLIEEQITGVDSLNRAIHTATAIESETTSLPTSIDSRCVTWVAIGQIGVAQDGQRAAACHVLKPCKPARAGRRNDRVVTSNLPVQASAITEAATRIPKLGGTDTSIEVAEPRPPRTLARRLEMNARLGIVLLGITALIVSGVDRSVAESGSIATSPNLKVAFIGDAGSSPSTTEVLQLIKSEGADMVIHSGDFDYGDDPADWDSNITAILGASFPYFACIGNHDLSAWPGYRQKLMRRLARIRGVSCTGDLGIQSACTYRGLFFILSGVGTAGSGHEAFIHDQLTHDHHIWRICSWHKDQTAMQVGGKEDDVGWGAYEEAIQGGAIVATGHEHSYARTRTLINAENQVVDPACSDADSLCVGRGRSFVFQSGLGGKSIRRQQRCLPTTFPYGCKGEWAKIYTSSQGAEFGALFIVFNVGGDPNKARGYFKNVAGVVIDSFTVVHSAAPSADRFIPPRDGAAKP